jgi:hypothetical protein
MVNHWSAGRPLAEHPFRGWQAATYRSLFGAVQLRSPHNDVGPFRHTEVLSVSASGQAELARLEEAWTLSS